MKRILLSVWLTSCVLSVGGPLSCDPHGAAAGEDLRRTYFVDSESGRDSWDGQAPDRAWQSLERVNAAELRPGDTVRSNAAACGEAASCRSVAIKASQSLTRRSAKAPSPCSSVRSRVIVRKTG